MTQPTADVKARINEFVAKLQALYDAYWVERDYIKHRPSPLIGLEFGVKNVRVTTTDREFVNGQPEVSTYGGRPTSRSVYCFIDLSNGDILKAAGWKAPAKGARGNIFNDNCDVGTRADVYGSGLYIR